MIVALILFALGLLMIVYRDWIANNEAIWYEPLLGGSWLPVMLRPAITAAVGVMFCLSAITRLFFGWL